MNSIILKMILDILTNIVYDNHILNEKSNNNPNVLHYTWKKFQTYWLWLQSTCTPHYKMYSFAHYMYPSISIIYTFVKGKQVILDEYGNRSYDGEYIKFFINKVTGEIVDSE